MKIRTKPKVRSAHKRRSEHGMAVIVVIALFAIMMMFLGISLRSLNYLRQDLKLIERKQLQRIHRSSGSTNTAAASNSFRAIELSATNRLRLSDNH